VAELLELISRQVSGWTCLLKVNYRVPTTFRSWPKRAPTSLRRRRKRVAEKLLRRQLA